VERLDPKRADPEYFEYECLTVEDIEKLLNERVEKLNTILQITPSLAKVLLLEHQWNNVAVVEKYRQDANALLVTARIKPPSVAVTDTASTSAAAASAQLLRLGSSGYKTTASATPQYRSQMCPVCASSQLGDKFYSLACGLTMKLKLWN